MATYTILLVLIATALCAHPFIDAFQVQSHASQLLPVRAEPIPRHDICQRLGLKESDPTTAGGGAAVASLVIGAGPHMAYALSHEHEVRCPVSGAHQGMLCTAVLPPRPAPVADDTAAAVAGDPDLVSQAILAGSLAVSLHATGDNGSSAYYLPSVITLVESLMAEELERVDWGWGRTAFNDGGPETNEVRLDLGHDDDRGPAGGDITGERVTLYACHTGSDRRGATADVYVLPREGRGKIWRFSVDFSVASIDLRQIASFGQRDSTTPLRPDVWLKDDSY